MFHRIAMDITVIRVYECGGVQVRGVVVGTHNFVEKWKILLSLVTNESEFADTCDSCKMRSFSTANGANGHYAYR